MKQASHLLKYDSTLGTFNADVKCAPALVTKPREWLLLLLHCGVIASSCPLLQGYQ